MKDIKFLFLMVSILFIVITGCKDDFSFEGKLVINSVNQITDVWIYSLEDTTEPIYVIDGPNSKTFSIKLNAGNYQVRGYTDGGYLSRLTFQVRPDRTVTIDYDSNNSGKITSN